MELTNRTQRVKVLCTEYVSMTCELGLFNVLVKLRFDVKAGIT